MGYIESQLGANEKIILEGKFHKMIFLLPSSLIFLLGIPFPPLWLGIIYYVLKYKKSEIAITDRQTMYKEGIISVNCISVALNAIESVQVNISLWGRIFGFGTLIISGRGMGQILVPYLSNPELFKKELYTAIGKFKNN